MNAAVHQASTESPVALRARDGLRLQGRLYEPVGPARATVLALPGIGVPQRVFRRVGTYFAERGVTTLSVDYRGIGESQDGWGKRAASLTTWARRDATGALAFLRERGAPHPVLLGHSFGGQALGIAESLHDVSGAVLVGSQLGHPHHWQGLKRWRVDLLWHLLIPASLAFASVVPRWVIGEPLPLGAAREWREWALSKDWLLSAIPSAAARFARFAAPIRAYAISDDEIAPGPAVDDLLRRFVTAEVQRIDVMPRDLGRKRIGHVGLFRGPGVERIWDEWLRFVLERAHAARADSVRQSARSAPGSAPRSGPVTTGSAV